MRAHPVIVGHPDRVRIPPVSSEGEECATLGIATGLSLNEGGHGQGEMDLLIWVAD